MSFENPNQLEKTTFSKINFESGSEDAVPEDFKDNPFDYVKSFGVNIKNGERKIDDVGAVREDPNAVKLLPKWQFRESEFIPVAKIINLLKGEVGNSEDPFYEYNIIRHIRSLGLPAPEPILSVEKDGEYMFLTKKVSGINWYERDLLKLDEKGWTEEDIAGFLRQAQIKMEELAKTFEAQGIIRSWKLKDMVFEIDLDKKTIISVVPTDFERTRIKK